MELYPGLDGKLEIALNLTPGGELAGWSEEQFISAMRSGVTPSGRAMSETMPWQYVGQMTDESCGLCGCTCSRRRRWSRDSKEPTRQGSN
jgi:hypothetical protein